MYNYRPANETCALPLYDYAIQPLSFIEKPAACQLWRQASELHRKIPANSGAKQVK